MDEEKLSQILKAAGDATRRALLTTLVQEGPTRVTDLANHFDMSLNAISKHVKVLEAAGLVRRRMIGREHIIKADLLPVRAIEVWFNSLRANWDMRIEALEKLLETDGDPK